MEVIGWSEALEVGIDEVDRQHRKLVDMLNEAYDAASCGASLERIDALLASMAEYASVHFSTEEEIMERAGYTGIKGHKAAHAGFIDQVARFAQDTSVDGRAEQIFSFLGRWLREHIMRMDREFAAAVRVDSK